MNIKVNGNSISGSDLFYLVWRGWVFTVLALFIPIYLIGLFSGKFPTNEASNIHPLLFIVLFPLVAMIQGFFVGGVVVIGNMLRPTKKSLGGQQDGGA